VAATINATIKSETANSYVTLTEANSYFETVPDDKAEVENVNRPTWYK